MKPGFTCFSFDLNRLKYANDTYGHQAGGDEFMVFADDIDAEKAIAGMKKDAAEWKGEYMQSISISAGYGKASEEPEMSFEELVTESDARMYCEKNKYYDENGFQKR